MDYTEYSHTVNIGNVNYNNLTDTLTNDVDNVRKAVAGEDLEITQWLSLRDPMERHQDVRAGRVDGLENWVLETKEFQEWRGMEGGKDKAVLFCYGDPGVGKTYLR